MICKRLILLFCLLTSAPVYAAIETGLWYDRMHNGHGLDLHRAGPLLFGTFYTYDARNAVDWLWLQSTDLETPSSSLTHFRRTAAGMVPSEFGHIRLRPVSSCPDGWPRPEARALLQMDFDLDGNAATWCLEPLLPVAPAPLAVLTGAWYSSTDPGWGLMTHPYTAPDGSARSFNIIYYHDAAGDPRWAFASGAGEGLTQTQTYYTPYVECTGCPSGPFLTIAAGQATLTLTAPLTEADGARNRVNLALEFEGSRFVRNATLSLASTAQRVQGAAATREGPLLGSVLGDGVEVYHNVPYVQPPVGALRWRAPQAIGPRAQLLDARVPGPGCPQPPGGPALTSEDCLQLNVWRPAAPGPHPVMLWIHGGGFVAGSAVQPAGGRLQYDGAAFARQGVVFVSINYRIGAFGFLAQRDLVGEAPDHPQSGNYGLLDQIAALSWVRQNIASFGGDPARVTVFGESAGGVSSCGLLTAPAARGLFQRAIVQSGNCGWDPPSLAAGLTQGDRVTAAVGCSAVADRRACLRALSAEQWLAAVPPVSDPANLLAGESFGPVVDGYVWTQSPGRAIAAGNGAAVPLMIGSNDDETTTLVPASLLPATGAAYESAIRARFPAIAEAVLQRYPTAQYPSPQHAYQDLLDDLLFSCAARRAATDHAANGNPVFHYVLTEVLPEPNLAALESFHGLDVVLLFGDLSGAQPTVRALGERLQRSWVDFAYGRDPGSTDALRWPRYTAQSRLSLEINRSRTAVIDDYRRSQCEFWNSYVVL